MPELINTSTLESGNKLNLGFLEKEIDREHGIIKRITSTIEKHFGNRRFPVIHITNSEVSWGPGNNFSPTGFVESIKKDGLRQFSNAGYIPPEKMTAEIQERFKGRVTDLSYITEEEARKSPKKLLEALDRIRQEFIHHGLRTNKNKVKGTYSIPAVVIINGDLVLQQGDDHPLHAQINQSVKPEKILGIFQFDPKELIRSFIEKGGISPKSLGVKSRKAIPFREEFSSDNPDVRKGFTRKVLHEIGKFRLLELSAMEKMTTDPKLKRKIISSAHDLVDIYLVSPYEFDKTFSNIDEELNIEIGKRRDKYLWF